jgi:hypothetical protein
VSSRRLFCACACVASLVPIACSGSEPPRADPSLLPPHVGFVTTEATYDGTPSFLEAIDPETHALTQNSGVAFDDDPHLRKLVDPRDGRLRFFIVGSSSGLLTEISAQGAILAQHDVGDATTRGDPLDVAIAGDGSLWVTRYFSRSLMVLDAEGQPKRTIDLSSHAPADGPSTRAPGMSAIAIVGSDVFVALRRLDGARARPTNVSQVVVLDAVTGAESASIELPLPDPSDHFVVERHDGGARLWVSCIGGPFTRDDVAYGLVAIESSTRTVVRSLDLRAQGIFVSDFAIAGAHDGYATAARYLDADNPSMVVRFDPETGVVDTPWMSRSTYALRGLALSGGVLLVTQWDAHAPGIELFDVHGGTHLGHIATRLPPVEIVALGVPSQP